jgi:hypothetical protein
VTSEESARHSSLVNRHSRFVVPLPHPSGASLWPNKPENRVLISRAMDLLGKIRAVCQL